MQMHDNSEITEEQNTDGDKWYQCPICNKDLAKYKTFSVSAAVYIICPNCKNTVEIKI